MKYLQFLKNISIRYWRRLTKELLIILPLILFWVLVFNLQYPKSDFEKIKIRLLKNSSDSLARLALANELITTNQLAIAQLELNKAMSLTRDDSEKKNISEKIFDVQQLQDQPKIVQNQILAWKTIAEDYPFYRDADLKLAILSWNLYRNFDSQKYLTKALEIDPNNEAVKNISVRLK